MQSNFSNPLELNAEYILIPGGKYKYSVTENEAEVPPMYFAKYPVTNKQYRRFINYLDDASEEWLFKMPPAEFAKSLLAKAAGIGGFVDYLGKDPEKWADKLRSNFYDNKCFNGDDQPVVGVNWFAAMAYCHWLNELQGPKGKGQEEQPIYRLPTEEEWEWAASGGTRKYPWGNEVPNENRANYGEKVGHTTPVAAYPAGATPEGLMDMAGNVWEWMENLYQENQVWRAVRGGSWILDTVFLRCSARNLWGPGGCSDGHGFRVVTGPSAFF